MSILQYNCTGEAEWAAADRVADGIDAGAAIAALDRRALVHVALTAIATVSARTFAPKLSSRTNDLTAAVVLQIEDKLLCAS